MQSQIIFGLNIFVGAFLVFFIQPTSAKDLLPAYGGSAFVWIASVFFFQLSLFLGYLYAYGLDKCLKIKHQVIVHFGLVLFGLYFIPVKISPPATVIPSLFMQILHSLILSLLLPMILVSATSPLLQHWYCHIKKVKFPYKFYALSNAGSLLGLLGFPFVLELWLDVPALFNLWSGLFICFVILSSLCCFLAYSPKQTKQDSIAPSLTLGQILTWVTLAFLGSALLVSSTFYVSQNLINMPLIWVVPLALYLISFIISFSDPIPTKQAFWYHNYTVWLILYAFLIASHNINGFDVILVLFTLMFSGMMVAHNTLYQTRPHPTHLTLFYLMIALGGMLGGLFVNLITMTGLTYWWDLYIPLIGIGCVVLYFVINTYKNAPNGWSLLGLSCGIFMLPIFAISMLTHINHISDNEVFRHRNFYGIISVIDHDSQSSYGLRQLRHGSIVHGFQYLKPDLKQEATSYYATQSGVGAAFAYFHQSKKPIKVGAIGLGAGTIAALAQRGDSLDFFEIDSDVIYVGQQYFSYLTDSPAEYAIYEGDGRMLLKDIASQAARPIYDLIVVDAFSGDTIPFHLLTTEAMALYQSLLKPGGIIALHISNTYLNLAHVTYGLSLQSHMQHFWIYSETDTASGAFAADWILLSHDPKLHIWLKQSNHLTVPNHRLNPYLWTDNNNSLLPLMRLKAKT